MATDYPFVMTEDDEKALRDLGVTFDSSISDLRSEYDKLQREAAKVREPAAVVPEDEEPIAPPKPGAFDYVKQAVGSGARAVAGMVATIPEQLAIGAATLERSIGSLGNIGEGEPTNAQDRAAYQLGQYIRRKAADLTPSPVAGLEDSFWATKVPAGIGSTAGFLAGGAAGKLLKLPAALSTAALGSAATASEMYASAKAAGTDEDTAQLSALFGNLIGTSEAIPVANWVNRLAKPLGMSPSKIVISTAKETVEETLQELGQAMAQNYVERGLWDKDRELMAGAKEAAQVGGVTGFLFSIFSHAVGVKLAKRIADKTGKDDAPKDGTGAPLSKEDLKDIAAKYEGGEGAVSDEPPAGFKIEPADVQAAAARIDELRKSTTPSEEKSMVEALDEVARLNSEMEEAFRIQQESEKSAAAQYESQLQNQPVPAVESPIAAAPAVAPVVSAPAQTPAVSQPVAPVVDQAVARAREMATTPESELAAELEALGFGVKKPAAKAKPVKQTAPPVLPVAAPPKTPSIPKAEPVVEADTSEKAVALSPGEIVDMAAFGQAGQAVSIESGKGKKPSQAWEKTSDISKIVAGSTAAAGKESYGLSRKLILMSKADGSGILASIYDTLDPKIATKAGGVKADKLLKDKGYIVVGGMLSTSPQKLFYTEVKAEDMATLIEALDQKQSGELSQFEAGVPELETSTTPADIAASAEPLSIDDGYAIFDALKGVKSVDKVAIALTGKLARSEDLSVALAKVLSGLESLRPDATDAELGHDVLNYVEDTFRLEGENREGFARSIPNKISAWAASRNQEEQAALEKAKAGQAPASGAKPASSGASGAGQEGVAGAKPGTKPRAKRNRSREKAIVNPEVSAGAEGSPPAGVEVIENLPNGNKRVRMPDGRVGIWNGDTVMFGKGSSTNAMPSITDVDESDTSLETQLSEQLNDLEIDPEAKKSSVIALAKKLLSSGMIKQREFDEAVRISKDKDMGVEDVVSELRSAITRHREPSVVPVSDTSVQHDNRIILNDLAEGIEANGWSFTEVRKEVQGGVLDAGGETSPAGRSILLYVSDSMNPSRDSVLAAFHEAADAVSEMESPEMQMMLHRAIDKMSDEALGITGWSPYIHSMMSQSEAEVVRNLERLSESVARRMTAEGIDPKKARTLWDAIVRFLRDAFYRAGIALQRVALGKDAVNPELLEKYFVNRLISFVSGDAQFISLPSWFGGPKWTGGQYAETTIPANGEGELLEYYDPESDTMVYREALENSDSAVKYNRNIRHREPQVASSKTTDVSQEADFDDTALAQIKVAALNRVIDVLDRQFDHWDTVGGNSSGITIDQYHSNPLMVPIESPHGLRDGVNQKLAQAGKPQVNIGLQLAGLPTEIMQKRSAVTAFFQLQELANARARQARTFAWQLSPTNNSSILNRLSRNIQRVVELTNKRDETSFLMSESKAVIGDLFAEMQRDFRGTLTKARRLGSLAQTIRSIDGEVDDNASREYDLVINRLYKKWRNEGADQFSRTLDAVASIDTIDWKNDSPVDIRNKIIGAAQGNPALAHLVEPSMERRSELAVLTAFGKSHAYVLSLLAARKIKAEDGGRALTDAIRMAMSNTKDSFAAARKFINGMVRIERHGTRIIDALEKAKADNAAMLAEVQQKQSFVEFHNDTHAILENEAARLATIGDIETLGIDMGDGAEYGVPINPTDPPDRWEKKKLELKFNGSVPAEVHEHIARMKARLDVIPRDAWSADDRAMASNVEKLTALVGSVVRDATQANVLTRVFGSITDKLIQTGNPSAHAAASAIAKIASFVHYGKTDVESNGAKWSKAESRVMGEYKRVVGRRITLRSMRKIYNEALHYIASRQDLRATAASDEQFRDQVLIALRNYWRGSSDTARLANDSRFWSAFSGYIAQTEENSRTTYKANAAMGNKVEDLGFLRSALGSPLSHVPRHIKGEAMAMWDAMKLNWSGASIPTLSANRLAAEYNADPAAFEASMRARFQDPLVWKEFVGELATQPGRTVFYQPTNAEVKLLVRRSNATQAYASAQPGNIVDFINRLYDLEIGSVQSEPMDRGQYMGEILETFQNFFNLVHGVFQEKADSVEKGSPIPRRMGMDARVIEELPPGWFEYQPMDGQSMRLMVRAMAFHAGGGRNLKQIRGHFKSAKDDLTLLNNEYIKLVDDMREANPDVSKAKLRQLLIAEAERIGGKGHIHRLENAHANLGKVQDMEKSFTGMVRSLLDFPVEFRFWVELVGTLAGLTVQGPGTALSDQSSLFIQPLRHLGFGKEAAKTAALNIKGFSEAMFGSLIQIFNSEIGTDNEYNRLYRKLGMVDPDAFTGLTDKFTEVAHEDLFEENVEGRGLMGRTWIETRRALRRLSRDARAAIGTGLPMRQRPSESFAYPTAKVPFGLFTQFSQAAHFASVKAVWKRMDVLGMKAVDHFNSHPQDLADPGFRFDHKTLGYSEREFNYYQNRLADWGISIEEAARDFIGRRRLDPNARLWTEKQRQLQAMLGSSETLLESSMVTRSPFFLTNPAGSLMSPMFGWAMSASNDMQKAMTEPNGDRSWKAFRQGMLPYIAILPLGLAMALFREWFDEEVVGRKPNVQPIALEKGATWENVRSAVQKLSRAGTFGFAGEVLDSAVNSDTARPMTVDSRIFFLNSAWSMVQAVKTLVQQSFKPDYASVVRPMVQAAGGSGYLQIADIMNNALVKSGAGPVFEAEYREIGRMNVNAYIRSASRVVTPPLDIRTGWKGNSTSAIHPSRPYIGRMLTSAYANDPQAFRDAYVDAVKVSIEDGRNRQEAEEYVKSRFQSLHPLRSLFTTPPSENDVKRLLSVMDRDAQVAVVTAIRNVNHYSEYLGLRPNLGVSNEARARNSR